MEKNKKNSIPEHFKSAEDAGNFWDTHDLADYWDQTRENDLTFNLKRRHYFIEIDPKIAQKLKRISGAEGISAETMVNL